MINLAVIGNPIKHSLSPKLFGYWFEKLNIKGAYKAILLEENELTDFMRTYAKMYRGFNITLPFKETIFKMVDILEENAQNVGAVNCVTIAEIGNFGDNTDVVGVLSSFQEKIVANDTALIMGCGGAARAVCYAFKKLGFKKVYLANRTLTRAEKLANDFGKNFEVIEIDKVRSILNLADAIINCTSLGFDEKDNIPIDLKNAKTSCVVGDLVYGKNLTKFLENAKTYNLKTIDGLEMLVRQAIPCARRWLETDKLFFSKELIDYLKN